MSTEIRVPLHILRLRLSHLIDDFLQDWREAGKVETPRELGDKYFQFSKICVLGKRTHSAIILAAERVLLFEHLEPAQLVLNAYEYDMEEDAYPILEEWRRRWWSQLDIPREWVEAVVLTDEDMPAWRARQAADDYLPPYIPVRALDVRHGVSPIGWKPEEVGDGWQRLHYQHSAHDLLFPPDDVLLEEPAIQVVSAWMSLAFDRNPAPIDPSANPPAAIDLSQACLHANLPGCAALLRALSLHPERPETASQLRVAQGVLAPHLQGPPTPPHPAR